MKIYIIGSKGIPARGGGVERHVDELAVRLANSGQDVFVYSRTKYTRNDVTDYNNVNIIYTPAIYTKHLEAISHTFMSILDVMKRDADIIHVHSIGPSLLIPLMRFLKPTAKVVSTVHSPDYHHQKWGVFARLALRLGERIASKWAHAVITISRGLQHHVKHAHNINATYIPNGVPMPILDSNAQLLNEWGIEKNEYIVAVNRLIRHKGLHFLIEAYKELDTDKKLVIVGGASYTDDYLFELHEMAKDNKNIIFTGNQNGEKLRALYEHAYTYVHPSLSEGLSISLLEALSYSQAVLASNIPENMEVMKEVGLSFESANTKDLETKLNFLLQHPEIVKQYKEQGREHVDKNYNWQDITEATIKVYQATNNTDNKTLKLQKKSKQII